MVILLSLVAPATHAIAITTSARYRISSAKEALSCYFKGLRRQQLIRTRLTLSFQVTRMAIVRAPSKNSSDMNSLLILLCGVAIGIIIMYIFTPIPIEDSSSSSLSKLSSSDVPGWKPVHVFYGEPLDTGDKQWFAQVHQDEAILDLLGNKGYFVDLAANDAVEWTNTLALERAGWDGLCVEPNPTYWYGLSHRKCQVAGALVGATKTKVKVKFRGVFGGIVGKLDEKLANRKKEPNAPVQERYTAPLIEVLQKFNVPSTIDYLSLDVEGAEYLIMKDFPFDKYSIKIMTVERPGKDLRKLFESQGYVFLKDLAWWGETLWAHKSTGFTPTHPKVVNIKTEEQN
jgi:hypothetical protein